MSYYKKHVFLCTNQKPEGKPCCANKGGEPFFSHLKLSLKNLGIHGPQAIRVSKSGCLGRCSEGPCLVIYPEGRWYSYASFDDLDKIIEEELVEGKRVESLSLSDES